jgi:hypothetical protein
MSEKRRAQLQRKTARPLAAAFRKFLAQPDLATIDVEMYWPPEDALHFLMRANRQDVDKDFSIPAAHWRLTTDKTDVPPGLHADIQFLFRKVWKETNVKTPGPRAYLRLHDSTWSVDLQSGREIDDRDRPDYLEPKRKPFNKDRPSTKSRPRNGELIRRGDALAKVKRAYKTQAEPDPQQSQYFWPEQGIRIEIKRGKVYFVAYFDPFPGCICGIWIGAHAWEVDEILGRPKDESFFSSGRLWQYDVNGFMSVGFDDQDRVRVIGR